MSQTDARPTIAALFKPSLLEWRAKYLAAKAAQPASSPQSAPRPAPTRRRPLTRK